MINLEKAEAQNLGPRICVIGVGGGGGNAVDAMIRSGFSGVAFVAANTDAQALNASLAERKIQLGRFVTQGLGAGAVFGIGRDAAEEALAEVEEALTGIDMVFIAAGMGGGTGSGAAPVIARRARALGILTVAVVTRPFAFEGRRRANIAEAGIEALAAEVDTMIVVPNQNLFRIAGPDTRLCDAFGLADRVLENGMRSIADLILRPGLINLDFADVRAVMRGMGAALIGTGEASGDNRAVDAAEAAIANPLLDGAIDGAGALIISIAGGNDMRLMEVDEAAGLIKALADPEADIIWGSAVDPELTGRLRVSIVATGLRAEAETKAAPGAASAPAPAPEPAPVPADDLFAALVPPPAPAAEPEPAPAPEPAPDAATLFGRMAAVARTEHRLPEAPVRPPSRERRIFARA